MHEPKSRYGRLTEWWRPKAGTIFSLLLFYLVIWEVPFVDACKLLFFSFITLTGFGLTGYFLNDWADIPYDKKVGKTNLVSGIPIFFRPVLFGALLAITLFPWLVYFETDLLSIGLIVTQFALQFAYPIPPVRLKRFPIPAMVTDALYAFVVPAILAWHTFDLTVTFSHYQGQYLHFLFLMLWMFATGTRQIINHHVADRHNDLVTKTPNITSAHTPMELRYFLEVVVFPLEWLSSIAFFSFFVLEFDFWVALVPIVFISLLGLRQMELKLPMFKVSFAKLGLDSFFSFYLGLLSLLAITFSQFEYSLILIVFLLLFSNTFAHPIFGLLTRRKSSVSSVVVNWFVYSFRKLILGWSEERNRGIYYEKYLAEQENEAKKSNGTVAVFRQNYGKYTETFVQGHLSGLPYRLIPFHGWPSPMTTSHTDSLIARDPFIRKAFYHWHALLKTDIKAKENQLIINRLVKEEVELILVEFGTMGARLSEVAQASGIPMVVIFYGYDAWHKKELDSQKEAYQLLFKEAAKIIGVSKEICTQLEDLGCSKTKIVYAPCYVNVGLFKFQQRSYSEPHFLAVGRFCHTKAPMLTVLAFEKVLKSIPTATLTIMGNDDGGVLESTLSLIKALGIEGSVKTINGASPEEVLIQMHKASIFVQHSITTPINGDKEGTPVSVMEAMATGLPVVATRHAGIAEVIENGKTGILINEFDVNSMAAEMVGLYQNRDKMKQIGSEASKFIHSNPLIADHNEKLADLIDKIKA